MGPSSGGRLEILAYNPLGQRNYVTSFGDSPGAQLIHPSLRRSLFFHEFLYYLDILAAPNHKRNTLMGSLGLNRIDSLGPGAS